MYLGQLMLMKSLVRDAETLSSHVLSVTGQLMSEVRMSTTDNYQGEESDIVRKYPTALPLICLFRTLIIDLSSQYNINEPTNCTVLIPQ